MFNERSSTWNVTECKRFLPLSGCMSALCDVFVLLCCILLPVSWFILFPVSFTLCLLLRCVSVTLSMCSILSACLSVRRLVRLSVHLCVSFCLSFYLSVC